MTRAVRLLVLTFVLAPAIAAVGCNPKADSTPNPELGPPPNIPPGRGAEGGPAGGPAGGPGDPKAPKQPK